jgi:thiol-disulfide isomerase/thioredoxin
VANTLSSVKLRPRLLIGSLVVALCVIVGFAVVMSQDDGDDVDAVLEDPQDRDISEDEFGLEPVPDFEGEALPEATLLDRDGNEVNSLSLLGDVPVVLNFWHSNCPPCEKELPDFAEVDAEMDGAVRFVGINPLDPVPVAERFAGERGVEYELLRDEFVELQTGLGVTFFPYTLFVTSDGEIVDQTGVINADDLREKVDSLLENEA